MTSKAASQAVDELCERSAEELRRALERLHEASDEPVTALRRRARHFKRDRLGMDVEDSGSHEAITVPNRTIVVESDPFPSPANIARRPSKP